jgi:mannose-6-phosphate isomerase-like protein (cupin superfamily)
MAHIPDRISSTTNAEHYNWGSVCDGWHLVNTAGLSVIQESMPAGTTEQMHHYEKVLQFFYILTGVATFEIDGARFLVNAGQGIRIEPLEKHKISNETTQELNFLVISAPKSHGDRITIG